MRKDRRLYSVFKLCIVALMIFISAFSLFPRKAFALASGSGFTLAEADTGFAIWYDGKLGNGKYYLGNGYYSSYPDSILKNGSTGEFVFCMEPGVSSPGGSWYGAKDIRGVFDYIQGESGWRTTSYDKQRLVARLMQFMDNNTRYDDGSTDRRIRYMVLQVLMWEVICEERDASFNNIGPKGGAVSVESLISFRHADYTIAYRNMRNEIEYVMQRYSTIPQGTTNRESTAPTVMLDSYDTNTGEYYKVLTDSNAIAKYYVYSSPSNVSVSTTSDNKIRVSTKDSNASGTVSGYNRLIRGAGGESSVIAGHSSGNHQYIASIVDIKDPMRNSFFKVDIPQSTLTVNPNGGTWGGSSSSSYFTQDYMTTKYINNPTRYGYRFTGWTLSGEGRFGSDTFTFSTVNGTLTANWVVDTSTLTVNPNGGSWGGSENSQSFTQNVGSTKWIGEPSREGYTFTGWSKSGGGSLSGGTFTFTDTNSTLTANWKINSYTLTVNPNGGIWNGNSSPQNFIQNYNSTKAINNPSRVGYTFDGWTLTGGGSFNGNTYTYGTSDGALTAKWSNEKPKITTPIIPDPPPSVDSNIPPYIEGGKVIIQVGDKFNPLDFATATDKEDGNITNKIVVTDNPIPMGKDKEVTKPGEYVVKVKVTDLGGLTDEDVIHVIVNERPKITAEDRYFFLGDTIGKNELLEKTTAEDLEDGDIKSKIVITKIEDVINQTTLPSKDNISTSTVGEYKVSYKVTDKYKASAETTAMVYVVDSFNDISEFGIRYISKDYLHTLSGNSKWKKDANLYNKLTTSLNKSGDSEALYVLEFNDDNIQEIKNFLISSKWDSYLNYAINDRYLNRFRTR